MPIHTSIGDVDYDDLDPGIRETVKFLTDNGFVTTDSGDGTTKFADHDADCDCALPWPHVAIVVDGYDLATEADRLVDLLAQCAIVVQPVGWRDAAAESFDEQPPWDRQEAVEIEASYDPVDQTGIIMLNYLDDAKLARSGIGKQEAN